MKLMVCESKTTWLHQNTMVKLLSICIAVENSNAIHAEDYPALCAQQIIMILGGCPNIPYHISNRNADVIIAILFIPEWSLFPLFLTVLLFLPAFRRKFRDLEGGELESPCK